MEATTLRELKELVDERVEQYGDQIRLDRPVVLRYEGPGHLSAGEKLEVCS